MARAYVVGAAAVQWCLLSAFAGALLEKLPLGRFPTVQLIGTIALGLAGTVPAYWNRWRVVEAFASRFTFGIVNFSIIPSSVAAFCYANVRLFARVFRFEHRLAS